MRNAPALASLGFETIPIVPNEKFPAISGWRDTQIKADSWAVKYPGHGIGLRLGNELAGGRLVALDLDIQDPTLAADALRAADVILGPAPTRTGLPPKSMRLYLLDTPEPVYKRVSPLWEDSMLGLAHRVEVLASGQQVVVEGTHPSGIRYIWDRPMEVPPMVKPEQLDRFLAEFDELAAEHGCEQREQGSQAGHDDDAWVPPVDISSAEIHELMQHLDPDCSYPLWLQYGMGLHHQYEGSHEGFELWDDWSARGAKYPGQAEVLKKWASFHQGEGRPVTIRTLLGAARAIAARVAREAPPNTRPVAEVAQLLARNGNGAVVGSMKNCAIIVGQDETLPRVWFDEMTRRVQYGDRPLTDADSLAIKRHIAEAYFVEPSTSNVQEAVALVAADNARHPVQDYLRGLKWDGKPRLDTWLVTYLGAEQTPYAAEAGRKTLVAGAARALQPGIKWDHMLILEGPQRRGKSSAVHALVPNPAWSADMEVSRDERRMQEVVSTAWVVECGELRGMGQADIRSLKAFLSRTRDTYRGAYERYVSDRPRQCIMIGTTNDDVYLSDDTGNRRFVPVKVNGADVPALIRDRDQLWAEAVVIYESGEALEWSPGVLPELAQSQSDRLLRDTWENDLALYLDDNACEFVRTEFLAIEALGITPDRLDMTHQRRIASALKRMGWKSTTRRQGGVVVWGWGRAV